MSPNSFKLHRHWGNPHDVGVMAPLMRPSDARECTVQGQSPYSALKAGLEGDLCWTIRDSETKPNIIAMFGVKELRIWSLWSIFAPLHAREIIYRMPAQVRLCLQTSGARELHNHCTLENVPWVRALGCFDFHEGVTLRGHGWQHFTTKPLDELEALCVDRSL